MSVHVLLNAINNLRKRLNVRLCDAFYSFLAMILVNSSKQEHEC